MDPAVVRQLLPPPQRKDTLFQRLEQKTIEKRGGWKQSAKRMVPERQEANRASEAQFQSRKVAEQLDQGRKTILNQGPQASFIKQTCLSPAPGCTEVDFSCQILIL